MKIVHLQNPIQFSGYSCPECGKADEWNFWEWHMKIGHNYCIYCPLVFLTFTACKM